MRSYLYVISLNYGGQRKEVKKKKKKRKRRAKETRERGTMHVDLTSLVRFPKRQDFTLASLFFLWDITLKSLTTSIYQNAT